MLGPRMLLLLRVVESGILGLGLRPWRSGLGVEGGDIQAFA